MKVKKLADIVLSLQSNSYDNKVINRAIVKAAKDFRPRSPNDVKNRTYLAICLYFVGDVDNAIALLHAIDMETAVVEDRVDLAGELATARVFLAHIYRLKGNAVLRKELMHRDGIGSCMNLDDIDFSSNRKYENGLQEDLGDCYDGIKQLKFDPSPRREKQWFVYQCYLYAVIYTERLDEFRDKISKDDEVKLAEALISFRDKFSYYLHL